jgi:DNA-directed RNA polymerase specialized sigma24 family protein
MSGADYGMSGGGGKRYGAAAMTASESTYELLRRDLIQQLQSYRDERHNIDRLLKLAASEAEADLYPPGVDTEKDRVQTSFDSGEAGERLVGRLVSVRKHLAECLRELRERSEKLDRLLLAVSKLPAHQGRVIIGLYIDGHDESTVAQQMGKSEGTICGYRKEAIRTLTRSVNALPTRTYQKPGLSSTSVGSAETPSRTGSGFAVDGSVTGVQSVKQSAKNS